MVGRVVAIACSFVTSAVVGLGPSSAFATDATARRPTVSYSSSEDLRVERQLIQTVNDLKKNHTSNGLAQSLRELGTFYLRKWPPDYKRAQKVLSRALSIDSLAGDEASQGLDLLALSECYLNNGDKLVARKLLIEAESKVREYSALHRTLLLLSQADAELNLHGAAVESVKRASLLSRNYGHRLNTITDLRSLADLYYSKNEYTLAESAWRDAIEYAKTYNVGDNRVANLLSSLAFLYEATRQNEKALQALTEVLKLHSGSEDGYSAGVKLRIAALQARSNQPAAAIKSYEEAFSFWSLESLDQKSQEYFQPYVSHYRDLVRSQK